MSDAIARCAPAASVDSGAVRRPRKFFSWRTPSGVPMDSGWYWSDSIGSVLCRRPMISPSSASAVISKQSGSVARSTASEW